ncbi:MAG: 50S ribosomal protein L6 [Candidatus Sumerlaeia bacterium]
MSRIGKKPIQLPEGVQANISGRRIEIKGPKGQLALEHNERVRLELKDHQIWVHIVGNERLGSPYQGLYNRLINNIITGVTAGFTKELEIEGVGYRAKVEGRTLSVTLGYSHTVEFEAPEGITITTPSATQIVVEGIDKQLVGQTAAIIRNMKDPDPYKHKGVRYKGERLRKKVGKAKAK